MQNSDMSREEIIQGIDTADTAIKQLNDRPADRIIPNPTQWDYATWTQCRQMCICGANQYGGKTLMQILIAYWHLTGDYPDGWDGPMFDRPIIACYGGKSLKKVRNLFVEPLLGPKGRRGEGFVPASYIVEDRCEQAAGHEKGVLSRFSVRHRNHKTGLYDGWSTEYLFSFIGGWESIAGYSFDLVQLDEECGYEMYDEAKNRTNYTEGLVYLAMVPLLGDTALYLEFERDETGTKKLWNYTIDQCTHLSPERIAQAKLEGRDSPLAEARLYGRPVRGKGLLFKMQDDRIVCQDFPVPPHFQQIIGLDFPHTTGYYAAVRMVIDPETKKHYLVEGFSDCDRTDDEYGARTRRMGGTWIPCAWPHDNIRSRTDSRPIAMRYRDDQGLNMMPEHAHVIGIDGSRSYSPMDTIEVMINMFLTGQLKVFRSFMSWLEEKATFKHKDGVIVPHQKDHEIDASIKAVMAARFAKPMPIADRPNRLVRRQVDSIYDL